MKISLLIPSVNHSPTHRPRACRYCRESPSSTATAAPPSLFVTPQRLREVEVHRYKCACCSRTFRHYPSGVSKKDQSERTVVLAALSTLSGSPLARRPPTCSEPSEQRWPRRRRCGGMPRKPGKPSERSATGGKGADLGRRRDGVFAQGRGSGARLRGGWR